jgi:hypothetical protein
MMTMHMLQKIGLMLAMALVLFGAVPIRAMAQDADAPCGRDENGQPLLCTRPNPGVDLEAACLTTGRLENCVPYHQTACQIKGFAQACKLYEMGRNCYGGDPKICQYYVSLLRANTACTLDRDQGACTWLQQQQF